MRITKLEIISIKPNQGLVGFANIILEDQIFLGSIGIHLKLNGDGFRLTYPTRKIGDQSVTIFHPLQHELSRAIEKAIEARIQELFQH